MICDFCHGVGVTTFEISKWLSGSHICPKCNGKKEIDWLEDIFGCNKAQKSFFYTYDIKIPCKIWSTRKLHDTNNLIINCFDENYNGIIGFIKEITSSNVIIKFDKEMSGHCIISYF